MNRRVVGLCLAVACVVGLCRWLGVFTYMYTGGNYALSVASDFIELARANGMACIDGMYRWGDVVFNAWSLIDQVLWVVSDWIQAAREGIECVFHFFMDIFLTGPMWQKYLASIFLLGVLCVIISAWGFLIYNDYLNKPENSAWIRGTVFGAVVMDTRDDLKESFESISKYFKDFLLGLVGVAGTIWFAIVFVFYCVLAIVFGCVSATFLTVGFVYGSCWAISDKSPFGLRPSHPLRPMGPRAQPAPRAPRAPPAPPAPRAPPAPSAPPPPFAPGFQGDDPAPSGFSQADIARAARARAIRRASRGV